MSRFGAARPMTDGGAGPIFDLFRIPYMHEVLVGGHRLIRHRSRRIALDDDRHPRLLLVCVLSIWMLCCAGSFAAFTLTEASGDGFTRGINRVSAFLGWQAIAGCLGVWVFSLGRQWPHGSAIRRLTLGPLILALALLAALAGVVLWARLAE